MGGYKQYKTIKKRKRFFRATVQQRESATVTKQTGNNAGAPSMADYLCSTVSLPNCSAGIL